MHVFKVHFSYIGGKKTDIKVGILKKKKKDAIKTDFYFKAPASSTVFVSFTNSFYLNIGNALFHRTKFLTISWREPYHLALIKL